MNAQERDNLLIRMDERQQSILKLIEEQETHLRELNNRVAKNVLDIFRNSLKVVEIEKCITDGVPIRVTKRQTIIGGTSAMTFFSLLLALIGKINSWW